MCRCHRARLASLLLLDCQNCSSRSVVNVLARTTLPIHRLSVLAPSVNNGRKRRVARIAEGKRCIVLSQNLRDSF